MPAEIPTTAAQWWGDAEREIARLTSWLENIVQVHDIRSEMFTNDADCAASLADRARAALAGGKLPGAATNG